MPAMIKTKLLWSSGVVSSVRKKFHGSRGKKQPEIKNKREKFNLKFFRGQVKEAVENDGFKQFIRLSTVNARTINGFVFCRVSSEILVWPESIS